MMFVVELLNNPLGPLPGAVKVTFSPATGVPVESVTVTAGATANAVFIDVLCGVVPAFTTMLPDSAKLVSVKLTPVKPAAEAVTLYVPKIGLAVKGAAATPELFVATTIVVAELLNNPLGPLDGAVKVTLTPATGVPPELFTITAGGVPKAVLTVVASGDVPVSEVIVLGIPAVFVSEKFTAVTPGAEAVTV
ncbi:MAG TPA: hypothetical protein VGG72_01480 [Bryobacteraceae bacterium]